jgi:hypothetical protein
MSDRWNCVALSARLAILKAKDNLPPAIVKADRLIDVAVRDGASASSFHGATCLAADAWSETKAG